MLYIFNKVIPDTKKIEYSLKVLYGINKYKSKRICKKLGINPQITINKIKKNHVNKLINYINKNLKVESFLRKKKNNRFNKLLEIKLIRALRSKQGLPVRGQRTHTNAKTIKYLKRGIKKKKKVGKKKIFSLKKKNYDKKKIIRKKKKKKNKFLTKCGNLYIIANFKNTLISLTAFNGNVLKQWSTRSLKKTSFKKNTPYNLQLITYKINNFIKKKKINNLNIYINGFGFGRFFILKTLNRKQFKINYIFDRTSIPFNGCRKKKKKRR